MAYQGQLAPILTGQGGFNGSENFDAIPYTDLLQALNVRFDGDALRKAGGFTLFDSNAVANTPNCVAGLDFWSDFNTQNMITIWDNGIAYKEFSGDVDSVELQNSLTVSVSPPMLVTCGQEITGNNRKVIMFSQNQEPRVINGMANVFSNCTALAADWSGSNQPMGGVLHDRRIYAWGNKNAPHAIYASAIDDHTNFLRYDPNDANSDFLPSFNINSGEGEEIRALHSIGTTRLFVFKYPTGIYFVDTTGITSYFTPVTTVRSDIGIAGPKAITKVGSLGTWFIGSDAHIYSLEQVMNPDVDLRDASITYKLNLTKFLKDNVKFSRLKFSQLIWNSTRQELLAFYTTSVGTSINNMALVINLKHPENPRVSVEQRGNYYNASWLKRNTSNYYELIISGSGGFVYRADQDSRVIGAATGYDARFRTSDTDFNWMSQQYAAYTKRFDWLELIYNATTAASVFIDTFIDGQYYNTYSAQMGLASDELGIDFILGTSTFATFGQARAKIKIGGIGKRFGLRLRNSAANADFSISKLIVHFVPQETGGEKGL